MSKVISILAVIVAAFTLAGAAAEAADLNIGVVNIRLLLKDSPQAKSVDQSLSDEFAPRQRDIASQEQQIIDRGKELEKNAQVMGESERRDAERELRDSVRDLERKKAEFLEDLNLRRNELISRLQDALLEEVQTFAREQNYDLIVGEGVLFASGSVDITAQVLEGLERRFQASN